MCKRLETEAMENRELKQFRRFSTYQELGSGEEIRVKAGGFHVDMGDLYKYLKKHNSEYMFKEYFGVEGTDQ